MTARARVAVAAALVALQGLTTAGIGLPGPHPPSAAQRRAAIGALLTTRERAVRSGDERAWMSTVDPADRDLTRHEREVFATLRRLPLATWSYSMDPAGTITLHSRLRGFDLGEQETAQVLTFTAGAHPRISADRSPVRPWDVGLDRVTRGARTLVLSTPADAARAADLASVEDDAIGRVTAVWGTDWAQRVVILLPPTATDATALAGRSMTGIAALMVAQHDPGHDVERIVVDPDELARASLLQRQILLRHETTHVATEALTRTATPTWLVEGYADLVGFRHITPRVGAPALAAAVRRGQLPTHLPTARDYDPVTGTDTAYDEGWLACRMLGDVTATALYRAVGAGESLDDALRHVTGEGTDAFTRAFVAYVRAQLS